MKKHDENLFQIGEVTKILGVTRKTLLVYEDMGLLTPAFKDEDSGYRYYSADNMTQVRSIRSLQSLGLSLKEVAEYYYDSEKIDEFLQRLLELRGVLDKNIQRLQARSAKQGELTVRKTSLPRQVCFYRQYSCETVEDVINVLREAYIAAARTSKMSQQLRFFTMRTSMDSDKLDMLCCIPVEDDFDGPERMEFAETPALCIYYRGAYEGIHAASKALMAYVQEHNIEVTGPFRSVYLEGPPQHGTNSENYITQVAVPIKDFSGTPFTGLADSAP